MIPERGTPADGRSAGAQTIQQAGEIDPDHTPSAAHFYRQGYPVGTLARWCSYRDRVHGCVVDQRGPNDCTVNGTDTPGALGARCWVPPFGKAVALGLIDADWLAVPLGGAA